MHKEIEHLPVHTKAERPVSKWLEIGRIFGPVIVKSRVGLCLNERLSIGMSTTHGLTDRSGVAIVGSITPDSALEERCRHSLPVPDRRVVKVKEASAPKLSHRYVIGGETFQGV